MGESSVGRMSWKPNRMGVVFPILLALLSLFLGPLRLFAREEIPSPSPTPFPVRGQTVEIRGWEEGKLSWVLRAAEVRFDRGGNRAVCRGDIELVVYEEGGGIRSTLRAQSAEIDLEGKVFHFFGTVEVVSREGNRIYTEELLYRDRAKTIETQSHTRVFFDGNAIECERLVSDIDFENPEFYNIIRGTFQIGSP